MYFDHSSLGAIGGECVEEVVAGAEGNHENIYITVKHGLDI